MLFHSFISTHTILQVHQGSFISLMDPPEALKAIAQGCQNLRTWPVLVGNVYDPTFGVDEPNILGARNPPLARRNFARLNEAIGALPAPFPHRGCAGKP